MIFVSQFSGQEFVEGLKFYTRITHLSHIDMCIESRSLIKKQSKNNYTKQYSFISSKKINCGVFIIGFQWANFIKAMLVEAKWCNKGYTPSVKEYLENGWVSSSGCVFLVHAFFATKQNINTDVLKALDDNHNLLYCASMICRLSNDLATSSV